MNDYNTPAFESLREKIAWEKEQRAIRYARFAEIYQSATEAGWDAHEAARPAPIVVSEHQHPLDDSSPVTQQWYEPEGLCGFAWVTVRPGSSSFARWLVKQGYGSKHYSGGIQIWVRTQSQSYDRKVAYAHAMADVLQRAPELAGLRITTGSRLD